MSNSNSGPEMTVLIPRGAGKRGCSSRSLVLGHCARVHSRHTHAMAILHLRITPRRAFSVAHYAGC